MVQWISISGSMVPWFNGSLDFHRGETIVSMVQWFSGSVVQWFNGSMVSQSVSKQALCFEISKHTFRSLNSTMYIM